MQMMLVHLFLLLFATPTLARLSEIWKVDDFSVGERILKKILESCYANNSVPNQIVIIGDFKQLIDGSSIVRMDSSLIIDEDDEQHQALNAKAMKVILVEDSPGKLQSDLALFKKTNWWNHMAPFFILGKSHEKCGNFANILNITWKMDIINSIYICPKSMNASLLYTLNPIADYAPDPWKRLEQLNNLNVFYQTFDPYTSCDNLHYDKTKVLNQYEIKAMTWPNPGDVFVTGKNYFETMPDEPVQKVFRSIMPSLNASFILEKTEDERLAMQGLENGTWDLSYEWFGIGAYCRRHSLLFPHTLTQRIAIIKSTAELSTLQKIIHLWSPPVLIAAAIAVIMLFSILVIKNRNFSSAVLDITRFLTYVSIQTDSTSISFRIYFTTMLIFIVTSNGVFQGKIAAFVTTPEKVKPVATIDELIGLGYTFYSYPFGGWMLNHKYPGCHATTVFPSACIKYVLNGTRNACILPLHFYEEMYILDPLDYVPTPLDTSFAALRSRHNWPLYDRVNNMIMSLFESGLFAFWTMMTSYVQKHKRQANDFDLNLPRYRPVRLVKLDFAFQLLAIGLSCSTIVFILELLMAKWKNNGGQWRPTRLNVNSAVVFRAKQSVVWFVRKLMKNWKKLFKSNTTLKESTKRKKRKQRRRKLQK